MPDGAAPRSTAFTLTFDDGPDPVWTPRILAELERARVRATFFVVGERVARVPGLVRSLAQGGHDVELHCHRHVRHSELSAARIEGDTAAALETLGHADVRPRRWRTPWGVCTAATRLVARGRGLELTGWTIDTHDWRGDAAALMLARVDTQIAPGSVVLMHDGLGPGARRDGCAATVALIEPLVRAARLRGLRVAPLSAGAGA